MYPCIPQFYLIKVEYKGVFIARTCFSDEFIVLISFQLVNNFQTEASLRKQEAEAAASKLSSVRKMIAKLLTSSNEVSWD